MNMFRRILAGAVAAAMTLGTTYIAPLAAVDDEPVTVVASEDAWLRNDGSNGGKKYGNDKSYEIRHAAGGQNQLLGCLKFDLQDVDASDIKSATLELVTETRDGNIDLRALPFYDDWSEGAITYTDASAEIDKALSADSIGDEFKAAWGGKKLFEATEGSSQLSSWTTNVNLTSYVTEQLAGDDKTVSILLAPGKSAAGEKGAAFLSKDASGDTYGNNASRWENIINVFSSELDGGNNLEPLKPRLVIEYYAEGEQPEPTSEPTDEPEPSGEPEPTDEPEPTEEPVETPDPELSEFPLTGGARLRGNGNNTYAVYPSLGNELGMFTAHAAAILEYDITNAIEQIDYLKGLTFNVGVQDSGFARPLGVWLYEPNDDGRTDITWSDADYGNAANANAIKDNMSLVFGMVDYRAQGGCVPLGEDFVSPIAEASAVGGQYTIEFRGETLDRLVEYAKAHDNKLILVASSSTLSDESENRLRANLDSSSISAEYSFPWSVQIDGPLSIDPATVTLPAEYTYTARVFDQNGDEMDGLEPTWSYSTTASGERRARFNTDTGVLTIPENVESQTITITAEFGGAVGSIGVIIDRLIPTSIVIDGTETINSYAATEDREFTYTATVYDQNGTKMENQSVSWSFATDAGEKAASFSNGVLTVPTGAADQTVTLTAECREMKVEKKVVIMKTILDLPETFEAASSMKLRGLGNSTAISVDADIEEIGMKASAAGIFRFDLSKIVNDAENIITGLTFTLYRNTGAHISLGVWEYADPEDTERTDSKTWIDGIDWTDNANKSAVMNNYSLVFGMDDFGVTHTQTSENYADGRTSYIAPLASATPEEGVYTFEITGDAAKKIIEHAKENNGMADLVVTSSNLDERSSSLTVLKVYMTGVKTSLNEDDDKYMPTLKVAYDLPSTPRKVEITGSDTLYINSRVDSYTSQFGASVYDQFGELYEDQEVEWSIDYGETKNVSFNTSTGVMTINKNSEPGNVTITARSAFAEGTKTVSIERLPDNFRNGTFEDVDDSYLANHWTPNVPVYKINFDETDSYYPWNSMNSNDGGTLFTRTQGYAGLEETGEIRGTSGIDSLLKLEYSTALSEEEALDLMNNNTQMLGINNSTANGFLDVGYEIPYYYMLDYYLSSDAEQMLSGEGLYTGLEFRNKSDSAFLASVATGNQFFQFNRGRWRTFIGEFTSGTENQINGKARVNIGIRGMKGTAYLDYFRLVPKGLDTQNKYEGNNSMQVVNSLTWTSDVFSVEPESYYTYYVSARPESSVVSGRVTYTFMDNNYGVKGEYTVNTSEGEWLDTDVSGWKRTEGQISIPSGATLCRITLSNPEGTGKIWFDGLVFTKTETAKADTIRITGGGDEAAIPESGTAQYQYTAVVYDQYNNIIPSGVDWAVKNADGTECSGITITSNGVLRVDSSAAPGSIIISASKDGLTAEKSVVIINCGESGIPESEGKYGFNGSFTENDGTYPYGWTNEDMDVVSYTFDNGIEGWKSTLNDYGAPEDGSLVWSSEENYTKKEGSSGSIDLDNPSYNQVGAQIPTDTKIQGGMLYNVETRFKAENISDDSVVRAYLRFFDTYGATIAEIGKLIQYYPDEYEKQKDENGWQRWSAREVAPKNATTVRPILYYRGGLNNFNGHAYFDDFRISKVTQLDYDNQYNGNPSLMLIGYNEDVTSADKDYGERWVSDKLLNISQGNSYKYSAMVQTYAADSGAYLSFIFYDEGGNEISTVESERITGTTNTWTELSGTVTAPADAASVATAYNIDGVGTSWISAISFDAMTDSGVAGIKIRGSSSVTIPANGNRSVGYTVETVNSSGNTIGAVDAVITASSLPNGVYFTNNMLTVSASASSGTVTLSASYGSYSDTITVAVTKSSFSGGGSSGGGGVGGGTTSTGQKPSGSKPQTPDNSPMGHTSYGQNNDTAPDNNGNTSGGSEIPTLLQPPEIDYFTGGAKEKPFDDIDTVSWAKPAIEMLYNAGVVAGKEDKIFAPLDNVTRAEFVTMLVKAFRLTSDNTGNSFTDVSEGDWYNTYVNIAVGNGIVSGMSEDYFGALENITRQDIAAMCMRLWNYLGKDMTGRYRAEFNDLDNVASYALEAVTSLAEAGIVVGDENGNFMPMNNATRAETAAIIYRLAVKYDE